MSKKKAGGLGRSLIKERLQASRGNRRGDTWVWHCKHKRIIHIFILIIKESYFTVYASVVSSASIQEQCCYHTITTLSQLVLCGLIWYLFPHFQRHTCELNDGYDWGRLNLQSVTEQSSMDDFLATAEMAGTEFVAGN